MKLPTGTGLYQVHHYAFVNAHKITIDIKAYSFIDGIADKKILASPVDTNGTHAKKEFSATEDALNDAVYRCAEKINNISDRNDLFL